MEAVGLAVYDSVLGQAVLLDPRIELRARQAEELGRARLVVPRLRQRLDHERALDVFEVDAAGGQRAARSRRRCAPARRGVHRQVLASDDPAVGEDHGALDRVPQLAHVPGHA